MPVPAHSSITAIDKMVCQKQPHGVENDGRSARTILVCKRLVCSPSSISLLLIASLLILTGTNSRAMAWTVDRIIGRNTCPGRTRRIATDLLFSSRNLDGTTTTHSVITNDNHDDNRAIPPQQNPPQQDSKSVSLQPPIIMVLQRMFESFQQRPPPEVEDTSVLLYDTFLLINLTASISLWAVHRMDISFIAPAVSEGCLLSLLWIASGLYNGAFLYSAVDGHQKNGGPQAASILAAYTFVNTINLRLLFALGAAILDHRPVGTAVGEDLLILEMGFGLVLMTVWRALHSSFVPRL